MNLKRVQTNIYRRVSSVGTVTWMVRWKCPRLMKWVARTAGRNRHEATVVETQIRNLLIAGEAPTLETIKPEKRETIADLVALFLTTPRFKAATPLWQDATRSRLQNKIVPAFGTKSFNDLTPTLIYDFYFKQRDEGLGRSSIHKTHLLLCLLGDLHQERTRSPFNQARQLKDFARLFPKRAPTRAINFMTEHEIAQVIATARTLSQPLLAPLIALLAATGLRREEALNLTWADIDQGSGFIHIRQSKNGRSRLVPIDTKTKEALEEFAAHRYKTTTHVIAYQDGTRPHIDSFLKPFKKAAALAAIEKRVDLHTLRHSYGSNMIRAGWGIKKVSMIMGHSDIAMTGNVYAHLLDGDLKVQDTFFSDRENTANARDHLRVLPNVQQSTTAGSDGEPTDATQALEKSGAPGRVRTSDLMIRSHPL